MGISISDLTETLALEDNDLLLLQRGDNFFKIKRQNLGGGLLRVTATLIDSQLEALNTTPIEIIEAPGVNNYIEIVSGSIFRNGTAFTATDPEMKIVFTGQTSAHFISSSSFLTTVINSLTDKLIARSAGTKMFSNTGISAYLANDVTTATGPVTIDIVYRIISYT